VMFELLNAYETAKHEKNEFFRFFYVRYVRHKLKNSFFKPFKEVLGNMTLDKKLLEEFRQIFNCVGIPGTENCDTLKIKIRFVGSSGAIYLSYYDYDISYRDKGDHYDIFIENEQYRQISIHPEVDNFENSIYAAILLMAIYNYCVTYIYGKHSKLYINDDIYVEKLKYMYF